MAITKYSDVSPLSRADYLLSHLGQECNEVAIRCSKAQMFGLAEVQPGQAYTNAERILHEICDVVAMLQAAQREGILPHLSEIEKERRVKEKAAKAAKFASYSRDIGRLELDIKAED